MTLINTNNTAILIIDVQDKLLKAVFNKESVTKKTEIISKAAKTLGVTVFVTEQYPQGLGDTVSSITSNLPQDARFYEKFSFNALADKNLLNDLKSTKCKNIIIFGIETHICVHQTIDALIDNGFNVILLSDCCGSRDKTEYDSAISLLRNKNIDIKTTEMVLFELLQTAKHPNFKEIQSLIK